MSKNKENQSNVHKIKLAARPGILAAIFIIINLWVFFVYVPEKIKDSAEKKESRYGFLDPAQEFYKKKDLIVDVQFLRDDFEKIGKDRQISIYFEYLPTGANIAVNKDLVFWPASLMKIPIAMAVMKKVEKKEWKLTNEFVLYDDDKDSKFGELYKEEAGKRFTVEKLLEEMLINSDNTARAIFVRNLKKEEISDVLEHLGVEDIFNNDGQVSAKKYSILWRSLYVASYLSPEDSQKLLEIMAKSSAMNYLKQGLPEETIFSHKIGVIYDDNIYSDSGIVYILSRPYILTVMMEEKDRAKAEEIMKEISKKTYEYISQY